MAGFDREEIERFLDRWIEANAEAERAQDWEPLADFYAEDAHYGWNYGPKDDFMAVGREEIRTLALGQEMQGLEGWTYPYVTRIIDDRTGDVVCLWRQIAEGTRDPETGRPYEVYGLGGSWFRYAGGEQWAWQRDFFDFGNVVGLFVRMMEADALSEGMNARIASAGEQKPGWYPVREAPRDLWPDEV